MDTAVSVIIPTYNRESGVVRSVQSVLEQSHTDFELLVIDDASTDHTREAVAQIKDPRLRYYRLENNNGAAGARNAGVQYARHPLLAFLDSGDTWKPDKLERQIYYREKNPSFKMVYTRFASHKEDGITYCPWDGIEGRLEGSLYRDLLLRNTIGPPTMMVDKDSFLECGGFNESYRCNEDWDFVIRFSMRFPIGYINEALTDVYPEQGSVSSNVEEFFRVRKLIIKEHEQAIRQYDILEDVLADLIYRTRNAGRGDVEAELMKYFYGVE
ncbi:MAG: glycosyltransferase family 2 protein [Lachnospiraceae bacterium]|nr:glycosyltransferase family 2 protein [Lachnospiraceae bacterium]